MRDIAQENFMQHHGLTSSHSYSEVATHRERKGYGAFCSSYSCAGAGKSVHKQGLKRNDDTCPDCGYALFWKEMK